MLAVLGAGVQGRSHLDAVRRVRSVRGGAGREPHASSTRPALAERDGRGRGRVVRGRGARRGRRLLLHALVGAGACGANGSRPGRTSPRSARRSTDRSSTRTTVERGPALRRVAGRLRAAAGRVVRAAGPRPGRRRSSSARCSHGTRRGPDERRRRSRVYKSMGARGRGRRARPRWCSSGASASRIGTPNCSGGRSSPPHSSHSTANADAKRASQVGQRAHLAAALRALGRQLGLALLEVALHEPAAQAERDPVAERLAPLLLQPVPRAAHRPTVARPIARVRRAWRSREAEPVGSLQEVREAGLDREDLLGVYRNMLITRGDRGARPHPLQAGQDPRLVLHGPRERGRRGRRRDRDGPGRRRHAAPPRHGRPRHARRRAVADLRPVHGPRRRADARAGTATSTWPTRTSG